MTELNDLDLIDKFEDFINEHRLTKHDTEVNKELITHTMLKGGFFPCGSYSFLNEDYEKFLILYKKIIKRNIDIELGFVERQKKIGPVICDIDLRVPCSYGKDKERLYDENHIFQVVDIFLKTIKETFIVDEQNLQAYVFGRGEQPSQEKNDEYKDGFHVYFPYVPLRVEYRFLLYQAILTKFKKAKVFSDIPLTEDIDKVYDPSVVYANGVLMIGSRKHGRKSYILTHKYCFNSKSNTTVLDDITDLITDKDQLLELTSLRQYGDVDAEDFDLALKIKNKKLIKDAIRIAREKKYDTDLVAEDDDTDIDTSIDTSTEVSMVDNYRIKPGKLFTKKIEPTCVCCNKPIDNLKPPEKEDDLIRKIVTCFKQRRCTDYEPWIRVGWALHRIWHGYLDLFKEWSKTTSKKNYNEGDCEKIWKTANDKSYCLPSLIKWAREDNPKLYNEIMEDRIKDLIRKTTLNTHDDIANIICEKYRYNYICVDIPKNIWYEFQKHRWVAVPEAYTLSERISGEFCNEISMIQDQFLRANAKCDDKTNTDKLRELQLSVKKIYEKCKDVNYKKSLIKACAGKLYDPKFLEKLDSNPKLIGFENGVFDLQITNTDKAGNYVSIGAFRDGTPDDFITFSTKYEWKEFSDDHPHILEILDFFKKVQLNDEDREYLLRLIAIHMDGSILNQKFIIWPGSGGNGKTATIEFMEKSMGDYYSTMQIRVLTGATPDPGQASPFLADKRGVRVITLSETGPNEILNVSTMKLLSGGDKICARQLFCPMFYFKPQFKMILACNHLPTIQVLDDGTWRRIEVLSFDSQFKNPEEYDRIQSKGKRENIFIRDPDLMGEGKKISQWAPAFMWYLLKRVYQRYYNDELVNKGYGLKVPPNVMQSTHNYRVSSDKYYEYISKNTVKGDLDDKIEIKVLYAGFKTWYKSCYHDKPPNVQDFTQYLVLREYKMKDNYILGHKLIPEGCAEEDNTK